MVDKRNKKPDTDAQLYRNIASQLETVYHIEEQWNLQCKEHCAGAKGIKTSVSGHVGGAEISYKL